MMCEKHMAVIKPKKKKKKKELLFPSAFDINHDGEHGESDVPHHSYIFVLHLQATFFFESLSEHNPYPLSRRGGGSNKNKHNS